MSILLYEGVTLVAAKSCAFVLQHLRTSPKIRLQKSRTKTLRLIEWFEVQQLPGDAAICGHFSIFQHQKQAWLCLNIGEDREDREDPFSCFVFLKGRVLPRF